MKRQLRDDDATVDNGVYLTHWAVFRERACDSPVILEDGFRGRGQDQDQKVLVFIPLETWNAENGLFFDGEIVPGQDICFVASEPICLPGTGGCDIVMLILDLPRIEA